MGRRSSAYFDREHNAWTVGRYDTSRAGRAESYSTYPDRATAERVAREENAQEERREDARRTIKHSETVQALADAEEYKRRFPGHPYNETYFVVRFNMASDNAPKGWKWEVYREAAKTAMAVAPSAEKRRRAPRKKASSGATRRWRPA